MEERQESIIAHCESLGENEIRRRYYASEYSAERDRLLVKGWLSSKEVARREAYDFENKTIARQTLRAAILSVVIAGIAAVSAIIAAIPMVLSWLH